MRDFFLSQEKYVEDLLKKFHMTYCKSILTPMAINEKLQQDDQAKKADVKTYQSLVSSLIYLTNTTPDIVQVVNVVSKFLRNPRKLHCICNSKENFTIFVGDKKDGH